MDLPDGFYGITDERFGCLESFKRLLNFGARIVQLRCKSLTDKELFEIALEARKLTEKQKAILIIDDRVDIALAVGADGVHLGQDDLPTCVARRLVGKDMIIGLSTHSIEDVERASCCDYIGVGPVFETTTKDYKPIGVETARRMVELSKFPAYLIGGITLENISQIVHIGAKGFVSVSDVLSHDMLHYKEMIRLWNSSRIGSAGE